MLSSLFARRPAAPDPATWTPQGTTVVQRYRNALGEREGAVVLVYAGNGARDTGYYAAACLGCTYRAASSGTRARLTEKEAADLANEHATGCRAMNRGVPAAPSTAHAANIVRDRLWGLRPHGTTHPHYVDLIDFHADRVDLQCPEAFITQVMLHLVSSEPNFLASGSYDTGPGTRFRVLPHPRRR
ncbi:hypothetical protein [Streptomyces chartreusis]|uniref:Uncharacterized protein n=1 Tax=Streptomyces chartreusis TaxID=1969 RepID=A0A7H8T556_STRCX|nr:hypothetical protein [Streptomyces chartreusis]QKZ18613.1 hypothetical protein HUT05_15280 [Streptomyces chartreusis]